MSNFARVALATLVLLGSAPLSRLVAADDPKTGIDAKTAFNRLKTMAGEWKASDGGKRPDTKVIYKVTAAGSTVMETQFPGMGHEMVTMYHLDGKDLRVTHYCAAGNQPRLKLDLKASSADFYSFVFDGGTNLDPDKDMHIHALRIKFLEGGKVESEWDGYMDGKKSDTTTFPMSRP